MLWETFWVLGSLEVGFPDTRDEKEGSLYGLGQGQD